MAKIKTVAYIGWRGNIEFEAIDLDNHFTGLVGASGAGKSTLAMVLAYALLPDKTYLNVRPITDLNDPSQFSKDQLGSRVDDLYGYAYVILDIESRDKSRLIAGIQARPDDGNTSQISTWGIVGVPDDYPLQELFREIEGDEQSYPDLAILKRMVSAKGFDFYIYKTIGEYCHVLHEAGILPTAMDRKDDRKLFGKLLETAFHGGISAEVSKHLKSYLLPEASRVRGSVNGLQDVVNQTLQTKRSLYDTESQLGVLKEICQTGKEIVLRAYSSIKHDRQQRTKEAFAVRKKIRELNESRKKFGNELPQLEHLITETTLTLNNATKAKYSEKEQLQHDIASAENQKREHEQEIKDKKNLLIDLSTGNQEWVVNAGSYVNFTWQDAVDRICDEINSENEKLYGLNKKITDLQTQVASLSKPSSSTKSDALAQAFSKSSLAEELDHIMEAEARDYELNLHGLTDGVIGVEPNQLTSISPSEDLPDMFWIGPNPPILAGSQAIGDWHFIPSLGGHIVASKDRALTFGRQARLERIAKCESEIDQLSKFRTTQRSVIQGLEIRRDQLHQHKATIQFFFDNKNKRNDWEKARDSSKETVKRLSQEIVGFEKRKADIENEINELTEKYNSQLEGLGIQKSKLERKIGETDTKLEQEKLKYGQFRDQGKKISQQYHASKSIIHAHVYLQNGLALLSDFTGTKDAYIALQTKNINRLSRSLGNESSADLSFLSTIAVHDPESCASIWVGLRPLLNERLPADLLDRNLDDVIYEMEQRRSTLREKVILYEGQVKVEARNIANSINQEINLHSRRIRALSSLGDNIRFGNATGVRVEVSKKQEMTALLEKMTDQSDLFSSDDKDIDEIMHDFFESVLNIKLDGVDLLDYRAYIDLAIQIRRWDNNWELASSLSGGEAVGCGLAFALMLFRSLADRGDIKMSEICPLFILDELSRIDSDGQQFIVEFCAREKIQLIITALEIEPTQDCKLYVLARNYDGHEQLIVRELRGFHQ